MPQRLEIDDPSALLRHDGSTRIQYLDGNMNQYGARETEAADRLEAYQDTCF